LAPYKQVANQSFGSNLTAREFSYKHKSNTPKIIPRQLDQLVWNSLRLC